LKGSTVTGVSKTPVKDERPTLAEAGVDKNIAKDVNFRLIVSKGSKSR
jgi:hypothetical protein